MSDVLTVPTQFGDISELADGLADRVDEHKIILYGPDAFEDGATIQFAVLLADGSPVLEGSGRVLASIDGGEERPPETRYDVVIDSLQLDGRAEVVYERMLLVATGEEEQGPATGEVSVDEVREAEAQAAASEGEAEEVAEAEVAEAEVAEAEVAEAPEDAVAPDFEVSEDEATMVVDPGATDVELSGEASGAEPVEADAGAPEAAGDEAEISVEEPVAEEPVAEEPVAEEEPVAASEAEPEGAEAEPDGEPGEAEEEPRTAEELAEAQIAAVDDTSPMADEGAERPPERPSPQAPQAPPAFEVARMGTNGSALTRPSLAINWEPQAGAAPEPAGEPDLELFRYGMGELPVPDAPPRPEMDPSYRVGPAPRPGADGSPDDAVMASAAAQPVAVEPQAEAWPEEEAHPEAAAYEDVGEEAVQEVAAEEAVQEVAAEEGVEPEPQAAEARAEVAEPQAEASEGSEPPEEIDDLDELVEEAPDPDREWD
ncbi:MAG: hypothetical protein ACODAU_05405 [Myxococcota bacterium]